MELLILIQTLALVQYLLFGAQTGLARRRYRIAAPAVTGHAMFERHYRVQMNTLEQLVVFLPALWAFAMMCERNGWPGNETGAALGVVWLVGRTFYQRQYVREPASRRTGFLMTIIPTAILLAGTGVATLFAVAG